MHDDAPGAPPGTPDTHHRALSPDEHRTLIMALLHPGQPMTAPCDSPRVVDDLLGLTLAEPVTALMPVPPMTNSAMDGFAVRYVDLTAAQGSVTLPVSADVPAGTVPSPLVPGTAARIMTGAALPAGADTIVRVEDTDHRAGDPHAPSQVRISRTPRPGADVRHRGEDVETGATVLDAGHVLDAASLASAISVGCLSLCVYPRPRVGIITTGSELRAPGSGDLLPHSQATTSALDQDHPRYSSLIPTDPCWRHLSAKPVHW